MDKMIFAKISHVTFHVFNETAPNLISTTFTNKTTSVAREYPVIQFSPNYLINNQEIKKTNEVMRSGIVGRIYLSYCGCFVVLNEVEMRFVNDNIKNEISHLILLK